MRIPLIEDLTTSPVAAGSNLYVFFDPASQWYTVSMTITAGWLKARGVVSYNAFAQSPDSVRLQLQRLGLNTEDLEKTEKLRIIDCYTATLGQKSKEKLAIDSLKVADMSIMFAKTILVGPPVPDRLRLGDNSSVLARFNDEKSLVELLHSRVIPSAAKMKSTLIIGMMKGVHSDWYYKQAEGISDGIIDLKLDDTGEEPRNFMRIRAMRNVGFDGRWHRLKIGDNFEVTLEK